MSICMYQRLLKGAQSMALVALISSAGQAVLGIASFSHPAFADGQRPGLGSSTMGLSLASQLALPDSHGIPMAPRTGPSTRMLAPIDAAFFNSAFPKVFEGIEKVHYLTWNKARRGGLRPQAVNYPAAVETALSNQPVRVYSKPRRIVHDTLLFALIFKDGQTAWNEQQLATMIADNRTLSKTDAATCRPSDLCNLKATPIPGTLWLFTALLIGFFGVGCRRQGHQSYTKSH